MAPGETLHLLLLIAPRRHFFCMYNAFYLLIGLHFARKMLAKVQEDPGMRRVQAYRVFLDELDTIDSFYENIVKTWCRTPSPIVPYDEGRGKVPVQLIRSAEFDREHRRQYELMSF